MKQGMHQYTNITKWTLKYYQIDPQQATAVQAGSLPAEQAQLFLQRPHVCDTVCPHYETLPAVEVSPIHQDSQDAPQQDHQPTLQIPTLRRQPLQQRHLQAHQGSQPAPHYGHHEDRPIQ
jgi:hypothetical protein